MSELSDLYSTRILALAASISRTDRLAAPQATATVQSKLCGSMITVDLTLSDGRISDYGQTVKACLLGQASAAVMAQQIIGSTPEALHQVAQEMRAMLKHNAVPPGGRWADLAALEPVREVKGRHASTLLVFDAVERALAEIATGSDAPLAHVATPAA
jgi:NifU-like protein involved in Fe-S cluster formation